MTGTPELRLVIDKNRLDDEHTSQACQAEYWYRALADAQLVMDQLKDNVAVVEAELANAMRLDPTRYGLAKVTDAAITAAVASHPDRRKATEDYHKARHTVGLCNAAVQGLEHRRSSLKSLTELFTNHYYTTKPKGVHPQ